MARLTRILLLVDLTCLLTCGLHLTRDKEPQGLASFRTGLLLIVSLMLFGCTHAQSAAESSALETANNPRDATYLIDGELFSLHDGRSTVETFPGVASKTVVQLYGDPVIGDLNGDGLQDAVVLLRQVTGGSGTFYSLAAAINRGGAWVGTEAVFIGDRISPKPPRILFGVVTIDYFDRRPGEAMAAAPSQLQSKYLVFSEDRFEEIPLGTDEVVAVGEVIIGHEVRSFTPCGGNDAAWLVGNSPALPALRSVYHKNMADALPYTPLIMILSGQLVDRPVEGFGADYLSGFRAVRLVQVHPGAVCIESSQ